MNELKTEYRGELVKAPLNLPQLVWIWFTEWGMRDGRKKALSDQLSLKMNEFPPRPITEEGRGPAIKPK